MQIIKYLSNTAHHQTKNNIQKSSNLTTPTFIEKLEAPRPLTPQIQKKTVSSLVNILQFQLGAIGQPLPVKSDTLSSQKDMHSRVVRVALLQWKIARNRRGKFDATIRHVMTRISATAKLNEMTVFDDDLPLGNLWFLSVCFSIGEGWCFSVLRNNRAVLIV